MYTLPIKKWVHHMHTPGRRNVILRVGHLVHDERFWPIVIMLAVIAMLIALVIWAGLSGEANPNERLINPFPYNF